MRIRTIKPEWLEDEKLGAASDAARVLSIGLVLLADDHGRGRAHGGFLAGHVWPYGDPRETTRCASRALSELVASGFARLYEVRGQQYYEIRNWTKHQKVDHPGKPMVPLPCTILGNPREECRESSGILAPDRDRDRDRDLDQDLSEGGEHEGGTAPDGEAPPPPPAAPASTPTVEDRARKTGRASGPKRPRGRKSSPDPSPQPLPEDWAPTEQHRAFADANGLDAALEAFAFRGHFEGQVRASWNGSFATWLANAVKFRQRDAGNHEERAHAERKAGGLSIDGLTTQPKRRAKHPDDIAAEKLDRALRQNLASGYYEQPRKRPVPVAVAPARAPETEAEREARIEAERQRQRAAIADDLAAEAAQGGAHA